MSRHIAEHEFETYVLKNRKIVILDFWAPWCKPCGALSTSLDEIETQYFKRLEVIKVNVDDEDRLALAHNVRSIPSIVIYNNGEIVETIVGAVNKSVIEERLAAHFDK